MRQGAQVYLRAALRTRKWEDKKQARANDGDSGQRDELLVVERTRGCDARNEAARPRAG